MTAEIQQMQANGWTLTHETAGTAAFVRGEGEGKVQVSIWSEIAWSGTVSEEDLFFEVLRFGVRRKVGVYFDADDLVREVAKATRK